MKDLRGQENSNFRSRKRLRSKKNKKLLWNNKKRTRRQKRKKSKDLMKYTNLQSGKVHLLLRKLSQQDHIKWLKNLKWSLQRLNRLRLLSISKEEWKPWRPEILKLSIVLRKITNSNSWSNKRLSKWQDGQPKPLKQLKRKLKDKKSSKDKKEKGKNTRKDLDLKQKREPIKLKSNVNWKKREKNVSDKILKISFENKKKNVKKNIENNNLSWISVANKQQTKRG